MEMGIMNAVRMYRCNILGYEHKIITTMRKNCTVVTTNTVQCRKNKAMMKRKDTISNTVVKILM